MGKAESTTIGLVGCGAWGRFILRDLVSLGCRATVVEISPSGVENANAGGAHRVVERIAELGEPSGVVVATPTATHFEVVSEVLDRFPKIPVFCEKPLTCDAAHARTLVETGGDRLFVMHKWRYHPGVEALAKIACSGELGPVTGIRCTRAGWGSPHADVHAIWILLPHDLSIIQHVFGAIPDPQAAAYDFDSTGDPAGLFALLGRQPWAIMDISARRPDKKREIQLHCRDGIATLGGAYDEELDIARMARARNAPPAEIEHRPIGSTMPLLAELTAFVNFARGCGSAPMSDAAEGARVVEMICKIHELAGGASNS